MGHSCETIVIFHDFDKNDDANTMSDVLKFALLSGWYNEIEYKFNNFRLSHPWNKYDIFIYFNQVVYGLYIVLAILIVILIIFTSFKLTYIFVILISVA